MVEFEEVDQGLALLEGDQGQEDVASERQIERSGRFAMAVPIFLPGTGVAFVVVAVFHRPVPVRRRGRTLLFVHSEANDKVVQVALLRLKGGAFFCIQSRWTETAERAPGRPALTGVIGATDPTAGGRLPGSG